MNVFDTFQFVDRTSSYWCYSGVADFYDPLIQVRFCAIYYVPEGALAS